MSTSPNRPRGPFGPKKFGKPLGPRPPRVMGKGQGGAAGGPTTSRSFSPGRPPTGASGRSTEGTHWGGFAEWYDDLVGDTGSDYHQHVVLPGVVRLLQVRPGDAVLDVACGQGVLCRLLHQKRCRVTGLDAAGELVRLAKERSDPAITYHVADARDLSRLKPSDEAAASAGYHAAACVLAIQNIDPIQDVFTGVASLLLTGGRFVVVMMHPAFRVPKHSHWGWDARPRHESDGRSRAHPREGVQYRRIDRYLLPAKEPITVHPGKDPSGRVWAFHRPLQHYVNAMSDAGLLIDRLEEWPSHRTSDLGPRAEAENRARREIPLFLALRGIKS